MTRIDELLRRYVEHHRQNEDADPRRYLAQLQGPERAQLEVLIDEYLRRAPRRTWDEAGYAESAARPVVNSLTQSLGGAGGLWPSLLPRLRDRARIKRADLVSELAARLGAQAKREKVARYYNQMEQGLLPADGVSDSVLSALAAILGQTTEALRQAGQAVRPGGEQPSAAAELAFARLAQASEDEAAGAQAARSDETDWDEVDRLFRGGA
jgi:hypothetical protein